MPDTKSNSQNFISRFFNRDGKGSLSERVSNNEKKITLLKNIIKAPKVISPEFKELGKSPVAESLDSIHISLDQLLQTIRDDQQFQADKAEDERKLREQKDREDDENKLETRFEGVKKIAGKILKPFQSIWSKIWGFISTILLGNVLLRIIKWMGDQKNQEKFKNILRFFKDWWPTMLASYLLFGTGFTKMVAGLVKVVGWSVAKLVGLIPKLMAALAKLKVGKLLKMIPGAGILKGALVLGGGALATYGIGKMLGKDKEAENIAESVNTSVKAGVNPVDAQRALPKGVDTGVGTGESSMDRIRNRAINPTAIPGDYDYGMGSGFKFAQGGVVSGPSGVDKVPARLTAGEFVMSKGAVQKWGVNTLASMNVAGGGTNRPTVNYNEGGLAVNYSTGDRVNLNKLTQNFQGGGLGVPIRNRRGRIVGYKTPSASPLKKVSAVTPKNIPGPPTKRSSVIAYKEEQQKQTPKPLTPTLGNKLPDFDPEVWISQDKIEQLGISI